jgi:adenylate cyclase
MVDEAGPLHDDGAGREPGQHWQMDHRLQAILVADAAGYSRLMSVDDVGTVAALEAGRGVFRAAVEEHAGRLIDTAGDSVLATFDTASNAVTAAREIQLGVATATVAAGQKLLFRIGVHLGDVLLREDGTVYGEGVNIAARLQALAEPGGVWVSDAVRAAVRPTVAAQLVDVGIHSMKNIDRPIHAFRLVNVKDQSRSDPLHAIDVRGGVPGFQGRPAIAVLPFDNLSMDPEQAYFADGIAEDILTRLAMWRWIPVIGRNSSFQFRGQTLDVAEVGRKLGARYVLLGSVRRAGDRVRITGQLNDAETRHQLWAQRFDRVLSDIFELQDEITEGIVSALEPAVGTAERGRGRDSKRHDLSAWDLFQRSLWHGGLLTREGVLQAHAYALEAAQLDPAFASPLAYAAFAKICCALFAWEPFPQSVSDSLEHASEALSRDPLEPLALSAHAAASGLNRHFAVALANARKAVELNPSFAIGRYVLSTQLLNQGHFSEAVTEAETAIRLSPADPLRPMMLLVLSSSHLMAGQLNEALQIAQLGTAESPQHPMCWRAAANACGRLRLERDGRAALERFLNMVPDYSTAVARASVPFKSEEDFERYMSGLRSLGWSG